ncbi:MAG: bifunctional demethylmenaquinone methyltransferase/2-methoxy-6-polyprenyl-1,4-benzoquinol methylase UbiE [Phycisphaerae bacterium]|jgi:demethylmenaquinone methyltransferase/2-methoxy-6-polyprenyl-1,4-benzoquinol methylase|nr:bifunctional demethylmenaquinone methyltransferase/2-methoxy-6-polyprenyl-1,4-benzoquinol methylase UbiE [Phycisphaerae bacterium]
MSDAPEDRQPDALMSSTENRRMFDQIAKRYDLMNKMISLGLDRYWRRKAVAAVAPRSGRIFLDVGCGTGDVALEIARQGRQARVVGVDPAEAMLVLARDKAASAGMADRLIFRPADITSPDAEFPEAPFDGVTCSFCIRNITDRDAALERMLDVLRPGGRVVILELTRPEHAMARLGHKLYNRWFVPLVGRFLSRANAYQYLVKSIEYFPRPRAICDAMTAAGFQNVEQTKLSAGVVTLFTGDAP